jgi:hypothetical protein
MYPLHTKPRSRQYSEGAALVKSPVRNAGTHNCIGVCVYHTPLNARNKMKHPTIVALAIQAAFLSAPQPKMFAIKERPVVIGLPYILRITGFDSKPSSA